MSVRSGSAALLRLLTAECPDRPLLYDPFRIVQILTITQAVIFVNTKVKVDWLTTKMREANFTYVGCA
jgi:superfamily II DNA/RNA helicase